MTNLVLKIPLKDEDLESDKKIKKLVSGTKTAGLIIGITKSKLTLNGYYTENKQKYKCLIKGAEITWEEVKRLQDELKKKPKSKTDKEEFIDTSNTKK